MKKYLLIAIILLLISCSEDDSDNKNNYFPYKKGNKYLLDSQGGEIEISTMRGKDYASDVIFIGDSGFEVKEDWTYISFRFNTNLIYFMVVNYGPEDYIISVFDENGKNQEVRYISYTIASDYIEINDEFGFNVKNDKGIVQIFYKNDMYN
jgi:hypothetical protein